MMTPQQAGDDYARIQDFYESMPKVELHMHIEGSFEPELVFQIAERNSKNVEIVKSAPQTPDERAAFEKLKTLAEEIGITPHIGDNGEMCVVFDTPEQLSQAYDFDNLQEFLDIYYAGMHVLQTEQDFYDLTMAYIEKCHEQNVVHTEIFFDPQAHTSRGVDFATVINGIDRALEDAEDEYGITSGLIMSYLRHLPEEDAIQTWQAAQPHLDKIIGVGLDSAEKGNPPSNFKNVFRLAEEAGLKKVAHAGEEGPPSYVWEALDVLNVDRIDHGNRAMEDPALVDRLEKEAITLTVCPCSNDKLQVVDHMEAHPILDMLDKGLRPCVNSDDPAYFGGYMNENFAALNDHLDMTIEDVYTLGQNAIEGSFLPPEQKDVLQAALQSYYNDFMMGSAYTADPS